MCKDDGYHIAQISTAIIFIAIPNIIDMGAWGHGIFEDDTALDVLDIIINYDDPKKFFSTILEHALHADYLEYTNCQEVLVVAALMDNVLHHTIYGDTEAANSFYVRHPHLDIADLKPKVVRALRKLTTDASELNELWAENEEYYPQWCQNITALISRLS